MDQREYVVDWEEAIRTAFAGLMAGQWHAMPGIVTEDSPDGHNVQVQISIRRMVTDVETGARSYESHPVHPDVIVHFPGGAGVTLTHGIAAQDEGLLIYASRDVDSWRQSGGEQIPVTNRISGYQDPHLIPGIRSDPRRLQQVDAKAAHLRSDDKRHVAELHPDRGHRTFSADPSTPPASPSFDPLSQATKFLAHAVQAARGIVGRAVDGSTEHSHGVDHGVGAWMKAMGATGLVQALAHPDLGGLLSSADGSHTVQAHPEQGVQINSAKSVAITSSGPLSLSAPPGMLSLPGKSIGSSALGDGAASQNVGSLGGALTGSLPNPSLASGAAAGNVGQLGGDLAGSLPSPRVTGIRNVTGANALPSAANDAGAAGAGVQVGGLYRNTAALAGVSLLAVRMS